MHPGPIPAGGSGRRKWIVRSSVGAKAKRPSAANAAGTQASVIAATSGASSARGCGGASRRPARRRAARAHLVVAHEAAAASARPRPRSTRPAAGSGAGARPTPAVPRQARQRAERQRHGTPSCSMRRHTGRRAALALDRRERRRAGRRPGAPAKCSVSERSAAAGGRPAARAATAARKPPFGPRRDEPVLGRPAAPAPVGGLERGVGVEPVLHRDAASTSDSPSRACSRRSGRGRPPVPAPEQLHQRRHEQRADDRRVDQHGERRARRRSP